MINSQNNQSNLDIKINSQSISLKKMRIQEENELNPSNNQYENMKNDYYFESVIENTEENTEESHENNCQTNVSLYGTSDLNAILMINENLRMKNCLIYTSLVDDGLVDTDNLCDDMHENHDERLPFDDDYINYSHEEMVKMREMKSEALRLLKKQRQSKGNVLKES